MSDPFQTGEAIVITAEGRVLLGVITLASRNGRSLFLQYDGMIAGEIGAMAVLLDENGVLRSIISNVPISITREGKTDVRPEV